MRLKCFYFFLHILLISRFHLSWESVKATWIIHLQISVENQWIIRDYQWIGWANILETPITTTHKSLERLYRTLPISQARLGAHKSCSLLLPAYKISVWAQAAEQLPSCGRPPYQQYTSRPRAYSTQAQELLWTCLFNYEILLLLF